MEDDKSAGKRQFPASSHSDVQGFDRLIQTWCDKIASSHFSKLKQLGLCKNMCLSLPDGVKLAKHLARIKTKCDFIISQVIFKVTYKTDVSGTVNND